MTQPDGRPMFDPAGTPVMHSAANVQSEGGATKEAPASTTPRTDAQPSTWENRTLLASYDTVPRDFARTLERELAASRIEADTLRRRCIQVEEKAMLLDGTSVACSSCGSATGIHPGRFL